MSEPSELVSLMGRLHADLLRRGDVQVADRLLNSTTAITATVEAIGALKRGDVERTRFQAEVLRRRNQIT